MSYIISEDCSFNLHEYCTPCECECHKKGKDMDCTFSMKPTIPEEMILFIQQTTDMQLIIMAQQLRKLPEDKPYLTLVLAEIKRRVIR